MHSPETKCMWIEEISGEGLLQRILKESQSSNNVGFVRLKTHGLCGY